MDSLEDQTLATYLMSLIDSTPVASPGTIRLYLDALAESIATLEAVPDPVGPDAVLRRVGDRMDLMVDLLAPTANDAELQGIHAVFVRMVNAYR